MTQPLQPIYQLIELLAPELDQSGNVPYLLTRIEHAARQLFAPDSCTIIALNPETGNFLLPFPEPGSTTQHVPERPQPQGPTQRVIEKGIVLVPDLQAQPEFISRVTAAQGVCSLAAMALRTRPSRTPLAVLYLDYLTPQIFDSELNNLLHIFADYASIVLQQAWLIYRYAEVARIGQELNQQLLDAADIGQLLQRAIGHILDTSYGFLLAVYQPATETLDFHAIEAGQYRLLSGEPFEGGSQWVITHQQPLLIQHLTDQQAELPAQLRHVPGSDSREQSLMFVPLVVGSQCLGVLSVQHPEPWFFDVEDLQMLLLLGNHVALALYNARLLHDLGQLNASGQRLTEVLDSEEVLQRVAEQIQAVTRADLAVLYPYIEAEGRFEQPPRISGTLQEPNWPKTNPIRPDDLALLTVHNAHPAYADDTSQLYTALGGVGPHRGSFAERERIRSTAAVPLRIGDKAVGALFINFRRAQRFDAPQQQLIEGLASYAAIAIANARAFGALGRRRIHELEALRAIDQAISETLDLQRVMELMLQGIVRHVPADDAAIVLANPQNGQIECRAAFGPNAAARLKWSMPLAEKTSIIGWVFSHKATARVDDVTQQPPWNAMYVPIDSTMRSEMDVPLLDANTVLGVINLESRKLQAFSPDDAQFAQTLASRAVLALKNAQLYERERRVSEERQAMIAVSRQIIGQLDPQDVFDLILLKALEVTGSQLGTIHLYDPGQRDLMLVAERGVLPEHRHRRIQLGEGIVGRVADECVLLNVPDVTAPSWQHVHIPDIPSSRAELAVPLVEGEHLRGVLNIEDPQPGKYGERDVRLLLDLADLAVVALQSAERYQRAEAGRVRLDTLRQVDRQIIGQLDSLEVVIGTILDAALQLTKADVAHLDVYTEQMPAITYIAHDTGPGQRASVQIVAANDSAAPSMPRGIVQMVADTHRPYRTGAAQTDHRYLGDRTIKSELAVPLLADTALFGVLNVESHRESAFSRDDETTLELLANQTVIAVQSAERYIRAKQAEQRVREAETMSSIGHAALELAHRLGNDLGPIIPAVNMISRELSRLGVDSPLINTNLARIAEDKNRVAVLIKALKEELSGIRDDPNAAPQAEDILVGDLIDDTIRSYPQLPRQIVLQVDIEQDAPPIHGVYNQLSAILRNLFANAIEAMPAGGTLTLRVRSNDIFVTIEVIDTGVGIPGERLARIFDLFVSTKNSFGFGLWSARRNALANGGDVQVQSRPGAGATFTLTLRRATRPNGENA